jgi:cell division transport system ATP-binding protein
VSKSKVVVAKDLYLGYKNEMIIEKGNFSLQSGDFVFLTGASGSGKTTLIRSLYGEIKPKSGYLNIGGFDMMNISHSKLTYLRRYLGVVFQDYKLINEWNIEKNVKLPLMIAGINEDMQNKKASKLLSQVKLAHRADKYPYELSGGEQQRAAVIRAIINEPVLILADEPTGNLDDYSAKLVMDLFRYANELGITILIATHHLPQSFDIPYRHIKIEGKKIYEVS